jgi:acetoin utilization protein AcuB
MLVRDLMAPNPITIAPDTTHRRAVELMREHSIHHLPVMDKQGALVGIVTEEDLLAAQPSAATTLSIYEIHSLLSKLEVRQIMKRPVFTTTSNCPVEDAAQQMVIESIGCLPVMDNDRLVGIITDTDLFQTLAALMGCNMAGARFTLNVADTPGMLARVAQLVADAGGNIVSVSAWHANNKTYLTIKEQGANFERLKPGLDALDAELVDIRQSSACEQKTYG